jgi:hypothetical protein
MGNSRVWIFRFLLLAVTGLLVYSWFQPWWQASIEMVADDAAVIHPWGLETNMPADVMTFVRGADMPGWFAPAMFTYLGIVIVALLASLFIANKKIKLWKINVTLPGLLIGLSGFSYIVVVVLAVIVAAIRTGDYYYMKLLGNTLIDMGGEIQANANGYLLTGYWLACAAGPLLILLALLRNKIIGKS